MTKENKGSTPAPIGEKADVAGNNKQVQNNPQKIVIAITGDPNSGKTKLINALCVKLREAGLSEENLGKRLRTEVFSIFKCCCKKIGVESQGDPTPDDKQEEYIDTLVKRNCDIIICACRPKKKTNAAVNKLAGMGYKIIWITPFDCTPVSPGDYIWLDDILIETIFRIIIFHYTKIRI